MTAIAETEMKSSINSQVRNEIVLWIRFEKLLLYFAGCKRSQGSGEKKERSQNTISYAKKEPNVSLPVRAGEKLVVEDCCRVMPLAEIPQIVQLNFA